MNIMIAIRKDMMMVMKSRVAKCHGYDGYIRVKIFAVWGKKF